jgi:sn1-specific diacylglycerol lipase
VYASFRNNTTHKPFVVFLDHDKKWLVVAVRGTLSLEDCLTDATCEPFEMTATGEKYSFDGRNHFVHDGFLTAAEAIYDELDKKHILSELIGLGPGVKVLFQIIFCLNYVQRFSLMSA